MKRVASAIAWGFSRFTKLFGNVLSLLIRCFVPVKKGRVMLWAYNFRQYGCNPRYLSEYLADNEKNYELFWVFRSRKYATQMDKRMKFVKFRSWEYFILVNTAEFLITNSRTDPYKIYWHKRPKQKYLMLWHGNIALKKVEKDAQKKLGLSYLIKAKADSKACDLMISGCRAQTKLLKEKFWYSGEILEKGIPRNDIFFNTDRRQKIKSKVYEKYNIPTGSKVVLYAPTFRRNKSIRPYSIDWNTTITHIQKMLCSNDITILLRLHPNLIGKVGTSSLLNAPGVKDATLYPDMQELLCACELLITDYSSSMFDATILSLPCILYATDVESYDRGYYYKFPELPYPLAHTQEELVSIIENFNRKEYEIKTEQFFNEKIGLLENGKASEEITKWMREHSSFL